MNKIFELKFGSHLYGTSTPESDVDYKAVYIPSAKQIVLNTYSKTLQQGRSKVHCERNTNTDVDIETFSLDRFLGLLMEGQTVSLDVLFAPHDLFVFNNSSHLAEIRENKDKLLTKNVTAFIGYARQQASKYGIKGSRMDALKRVAVLLDRIPEHSRLSTHECALLELVNECGNLVSLEKAPLIEIVMLKGPEGQMDSPHLQVNGRFIPLHATVKYAATIVNKMLYEYGQRANKAHLAGGVDWKALSHAVRVNSQGIELLNTGNITFPRPDRQLLTDIKTGKLSYEEVAPIIEQGLVDLLAARETSTLRDEPDREWANDFIYRVYSDVVRNEQ